MEYRTLGSAGVKVSPLCLGCMNFGGATSEEDSIRIIHAALDAGINFLDTANVYNKGVSEEFVGKALQGKRDQVFLATKVHGTMGPGPNDSGNSRYHIFQQVEASLKRLKTDRIDLYQLHRPDSATPMEEQLGALTDLVRQGKVRYLGTSTFPAWQLCEAMWISDRKNLERFVCEQPPYSILSRKIEADVLPFCRKYGFAVIPWSPLAGGWLSGKYRKGQKPPEGSRGARRGWETDPDSPSEETRLRVDAVEKLVAVADQAGIPLSQFALAWNLANPIVTAPIIGPRTMEQLQDNLKAIDVSLGPDTLEAVDAICPPRSDFMRYG